MLVPLFMSCPSYVLGAESVRATGGWWLRLRVEFDEPPVVVIDKDSQRNGSCPSSHRS